MGQMYKEKIRFHPRAGRERLRRAYVALILRFLDDVLDPEHDRPLPALLLLRIDTFATSDNLEAQLVAFETLPEYKFLSKFFGVKEG